MSETAITFECGGSPLVGILHRPDRPAPRGVLIVVGGGPQYRAGGHRQLVLWARRLAAAGYPVFRFDYRGMGDSHGEFRGFEDVDEDIKAAVDRFQRECPEVKEIVLWGECDAAAAILFYAWSDARVRGTVLLNPWVRTEGGQAQTILRHYYLDRLRDRSFWRKVVTLQFNPLKSLGSAARLVVNAVTTRSQTGQGQQQAAIAGIPRDLPLPERLLAGYRRFPGPCMLVLSGRDIIAREFDTAISGSDAWQAALNAKPPLRHDLALADHTFSTAAWRDQVVSWGIDWLRSW